MVILPTWIAFTFTLKGLSIECVAAAGLLVLLLVSLLPCPNIANPRLTNGHIVQDVMLISNFCNPHHFHIVKCLKVKRG